MKELRIIVIAREDLPGYPFTARLVGSHVWVAGHLVAGAIKDLFTGRLAAARKAEFEAQAGRDA